jgi:Lysophospholipase L1 and related esterases
MPCRLLPPLAAFLFLAAVSLASAAAVSAQQPPAYLALGDSLAFGVGADNPAEQGYVGLTAANLRLSKYSSTGLDLVNLSAPGATSADLLQPGGQLDRAISEIQRRGGVDIISIGVGANDLLALAESSSPCFQSAASKACQDALGQTLAGLQSNLSSVLRQLRAAAPNAQIYVLDIHNPYSGTNDPRAIVASVGVQQVNGVIAAAAADPSLSAKFVSIHGVFEGRARQWIASDGIHPNNDGYRVMAEALLAAIEGQSPVLPSDLAALSTAAVGAGSSVSSGDSGVNALVPEVGIPAAFAAGLLLSAAYFVVRGRR